ncbi:LysM domain protein [Sporothrix schenckii 1099-18]|uniref:LysM domain protein n=1 Tax=Sporothrix schenckii 1099-18 TaxID=1397361 RepID=A0A0F2M906_SPOSC|nr:LysM domain protein [Sporothrix schenckii 1099-18]KJR85305.1 LysM domain protein [Sporothrix schenckii 1099-18]
MPSLLKVAVTVAGFLSAASAAALQRQDCTWSVVASATDTCATIAAAWGLNVGQFAVYNPITGWNCSDGVIAGETYCVEQNYGLSALPTSPSITPPLPSPTSGDPSSGGTGTGTGTETVSAPTTPTAPNGSPIPSPVQDGITPDCISFYKVAKGDTCAKVVKKFGTFSLSDFYAWNPAVGTDCSGLWIDTYVCVGTTATSTTKPTTSKPTSSSPTGSPLPSPTQDGLTDKCTRFYKVVKGDTCAKIVAKYGTFSLDDFYGWNPAIGNDCSGLWLDTYVCVGVPGTPTAKPTPTPTKGPSPVQDGIDPSCNSFYKVVKGDTCQKIVSSNKNKITLAEFYKWNPAVGDDCSSLYLDYYVCVGVGKKRRSVKVQ